MPIGRLESVGNNIKIGLEIGMYVCGLMSLAWDCGQVASSAGVKTKLRVYNTL
jgi:hypothetical protein